MRLVHLFARLRRGAAFVVLGVGLTTLALSLSQCRMVEERLTGISLDSAKPGKCISQCAEAFVESKALEVDRHQAAVRACAKDPVCLALENIRFEPVYFETPAFRGKSSMSISVTENPCA